jgi:hypothetical protein
VDADVAVFDRHAAQGEAGGQRPQAAGVLFQAVAESLISQVHHRQQPALGEHVGDLLPVPGRRIGARRIVTAAVQQHRVTGRQPAQAVEHRLDIHA